jgi:hypothetical protein
MAAVSKTKRRRDSIPHGRLDEGRPGHPSAPGRVTKSWRSIPSVASAPAIALRPREARRKSLPRSYRTLVLNADGRPLSTYPLSVISAQQGASVFTDL